MDTSLNLILTDIDVLLTLHEQILYELLRIDISDSSHIYLREELSEEVTKLLDILEDIERANEITTLSEHTEELERYEERCRVLLEKVKREFEKITEFLTAKMERLDQLLEL